MICIYSELIKYNEGEIYKISSFDDLFFECFGGYIRDPLGSLYPVGK